ncbi:hypothetical protein BDM02DRAFT_3106606 [Thelephora ganbajun]|uniref:Uncharacterized protein n=1 Tax=Thelephora ganbajun TaxID=370292 RepID=A0ACB6ZXV1_THEGA|nr:hypothetical protein BDM02DRAFT_3106606 [Thelephora ganbajun]
MEAMFALASSCMLLRWLNITQTYLLKAIHIANECHMSFVPKDGPVPVFSGDVHEHITQLSQLIYLENFLFLTRNGVEPKATSRLEEEFRTELEASYPFAFDTCPLIMRTRGILLIRDAIFVLGVYPSQSAMLKDWRTLCSKIINQLQAHTDALQQCLGWFTSIGDKESSDVIWSNCISCLAYLANLYLIIAPTDYPTAPAVESLCDTTLSTLGRLTEAMVIEEYSYFDLLLGMCWKRAMEGFKTRTSLLPVEETTTLVHWWKIVADAYTTYKDKIPDCEPPLLSSLALLEDGRTEDSKYPNLLYSQTRAELGI